MKNQFFYRRKLPHWHLPESIFSLTPRLYGSIPGSVIDKIKEHGLAKRWTTQEYFSKYELELDINAKGPFWLHDERIANLVIESLLFSDQKEYDLSCATLMGNHVHVVLKTFQKSLPLDKILQNHKKYTGRLANSILNRSGSFWEEETFDTVIRNETHYWNVVNYCLQNPVKAGFVTNWQDWKWTYLKPSLKGFIK